MATDLIPGTLDLVNPTDYNLAYLDIKLDNALNKILNITMFSNLGYGISFRAEITVCGNENIVCSSCATRVTQNLTGAGTKIYDANTNQMSFTLTADTTAYPD